MSGEDIFSWACRNRYGIEPPWEKRSFAISGPVSLTAEDRERITVDVERRIKSDDTIYSGAAYGVDTIAAKAARHANANLILVAPTDKWHNTSLYEIADEIIHVPGEYMDRNDRLADEADALIAYPPTSKHELRSGTWATVRRFRKRDKPVTLVPLDSLP